MMFFESPLSVTKAIESKWHRVAQEEVSEADGKTTVRVFCQYDKGYGVILIAAYVHDDYHWTGLEVKRTSTDAQFISVVGAVQYYHLHRDTVLRLLREKIAETATD